MIAFNNGGERVWKRGAPSTRVEPITRAATEVIPATENKEALLRLNLTAVERRRGQIYMFAEGNVWSLMNTFTLVGGTIVTAFALYLGANDFAIGLLSALPLLAALLQLWTPQIVTKLGSRQRTCVITLGWARILLIPLTALAACAWFWPAYNTLWLISVIAVLTLSAALTAVGGTSWLSWAATVVPLSQRASFFAWRTTTISAVGLVAALLAGFFMDWWSIPVTKQGVATGQHQAFPAVYVILFGVAAFCGIITIFLLRRTPDLPAQSTVNSEVRPHFWRGLAESWQHLPLRRFMIFRGVWLFAVGVAVPYYTVFMLQNLKLDFTQVFFLQNIGALAGLLATPWWGRMLKKYGCSRIIKWTTWLKVLYVVVWAILPSVPQYAFLILILLNISLVVDAGLNLSAGNLLMNLIPDERGNNVSHYSVFNAVTSLTSAIGPLLAGFLLNGLVGIQLNLFGLTLTALPLLFVLSGVLRAVTMFFFKGFDDRDLVSNY